MQYRLLGRSGLKVSVFSFGAMTFGGSGMFAMMGSTRGAEARRQIDMCLEAGVNLFDTADIYSAGESEALLSEALGARRPQGHAVGAGSRQCGHAEDEARESLPARREAR